MVKEEYRQWDQERQFAEIKRLKPKMSEDQLRKVDGRIGEIKNQILNQINQSPKVQLERIGDRSMGNVKSSEGFDLAIEMPSYSVKLIVLTGEGKIEGWPQ